MIARLLFLGGQTDGRRTNNSPKIDQRLRSRSRLLNLRNGTGSMTANFRQNLKLSMDNPLYFRSQQPGIGSYYQFSQWPRDTDGDVANESLIRE